MTSTRAMLASALLSILAAGAAPAQGARSIVRQFPRLGPELPFAMGERLVYDGTAGPGLRGRGEMWIDGPEEIRGTPVIVLHFTFSARVGFLRVADQTTSWLDPLRMSTLRFVKEEHHLLARRSEDVSMDPLGRHWKAADGREGTSESDAPLDELSFIYAIRTFSLRGDSVLVLARHFDAARSPTTLRSLGAGTVTTPAGTFATREVEMRVRDSRNYRGEGIIRFSLSDDACRRPVRIQSTIPGAGTVVLSLRSARPVVAGCAGTGAPDNEAVAAAP